MKKWILGGILLAVLVAGVTGYRMYNKPHKNMAEQPVKAALTAEELLASYSANAGAADAAFLGQVIEVTGRVVEQHTDESGIMTILLDTGDPMSNINCELDTVYSQQVTRYNPGDQVTIRGECSGMDLDIVLMRCIISQSN